MATGRLNKQGNWLTETTHLMRDCQHYEHDVCKGSEWERFHTPQDASFFGVWVNESSNVVLTFIEGDEMVVHCINDHQFQKELHAMSRFYEHC